MAVKGRAALLLLGLLGLAALFRAPAALRSDVRRATAPAELPIVEREPVFAAPETAARPAEEPAEEPSTVDVEPALPNLRWLLAHQNADGTWGDVPVDLDGARLDRAGLTALVLLSFLEAGYTHLSKDVYDGVETGAAVRRALQWLVADLDVDGRFRSARSVLDQVLGAYALIEAYGWTGSPRYVDAARASLDAVVRLQGRDGSWGDRTTTAWAGEILYGARISDLAVRDDVPLRLLQHYDRRGTPDAPELMARLRFGKHHPAVREAVDRLQGPVASLQETLFRTRALYRFDAPEGPAWKAWKPFAREAVKTPPAGTTLSETALRAALTELIVEAQVVRSPIYVAK